MKTTSRSEKTRQHLFKVAIDLFLDNGYQDTTLIDIAKAADVSTGTLYRYYPSKGDFLMEIGKNSVAHLEEYAKEIPGDTSLFEAILSVLLEDARGTQKVFFSTGELVGEAGPSSANDIRMAYNYEIYASKEHLDIEQETRKNLAHLYFNLIEQAKERGQIARDLHSEALSEIIVAIFFDEFDRGMYQFEYPYEERFREKLSILFGAKKE